MSSSTEPEGTDGPTEDELREYVGKLRSAPAEQILSEILFTALNAAQVKLGRRDARLFIDLCALVRERLGDYLPAEVGTQVDQALNQLRLAQVQAEGDLGESGEAEPNDLEQAPSGIVSGDAGRQEPASGPSSSSAGSKLWVPGRDV